MLDPTLFPGAPPMDPEVQAHLPLHPRDHLILLALASGPMHGYGIIKEITRDSGGTVAMDPANLYRSIKRLRRSGLVREAEEVEEEPPSERRRYYSTTRLGDRVVRAEAERLAGLTVVARRRRLV